MSTADKPWSGQSGGAADERRHGAVLQLPAGQQGQGGGPRERLRRVRAPLQQSVQRQAGLGREHDPRHAASQGQEHGDVAYKSTHVQVYSTHPGLSLSLLVNHLTRTCPMHARTDSVC
jgi:hypothetical protein